MAAPIITLKIILVVKSCFGLRFPDPVRPRTVVERAHWVPRSALVSKCVSCLVVGSHRWEPSF